MGNNSNFLTFIGLTNKHSEDLGRIAGVASKDFNAAWCSSYTCASNLTAAKRGKIVYVGKFPPNKCPKCHHPNFLFHDSVSPAEARRLQGVLK